MGCRASLYAKIENKVQALYLHWEGHPFHVMPILTECYNDQAKVQALFALGDLSYLDRSCECPPGHSASNPVKGHTVAYARDRDEEIRIRTYPDLIEARDHENHGYEYSWDGTVWTYLDDKSVTRSK